MEEPIFEIDVVCKEAVSVKGQNMNIVMIPFTGTTAGPHFTGNVVGEGVDTQKISAGGTVLLSARYMLEGKDAEGMPCRVFIENQGCEETGYHPVIVTDSKYLSQWETVPLISTIEGKPGGVMVRIYEDRQSQSR